MTLGLPLASLQRRRLRRSGWWHPRSFASFDFERGRYFLRGVPREQGGLLSVTRSSPIILRDKAGIYQVLGVNELPRTDAGLYGNGQSQNKCVNDNANPSSTSGLNLTSGLAVTTPVESALVAAAGLQNVCTSGRIYRASADGTTNTVTVSGTVGNTNPHTLSGWLYVVSGAVQVVLVGQAALGTLAPNGGLTHFSFTGSPTATSRNLGFRTTAAAEYYFILNQLEESTFAGPPIVTSGAAATLLASNVAGAAGTRPSDGLPEPLHGWEAAGLDNGFTILIELDLNVRNASTRRPVSFSGGGGAFRIETAMAGTGFRVYSNDGDLDGTVNFQGDLAGGRSRAAVRAVGQVITTARQGFSGVTSVARGFVQKPQSLHIGNQVNLRAPWNDNMYGLEICPPLSDGQMLTWVNAA